MSWAVDIKPRLEKRVGELARKGCTDNSATPEDLEKYKDKVRSEAEHTNESARILQRLLEAQSDHWNPIDWWTGSRDEKAWDAIHDADRLRLNECEDPDDLGVAAIGLTRRIRQLPANDPLRGEAETWLTEGVVAWLNDSGGPKPDCGPRLAALHAATYAARDEWHRTLRHLRNMLLGTALALTAGWLILALIKAGWSNTALPICGKDKVCLAGDGTWDLLEISLVGALGGLVGAAIPLTKLSAVATRYNVRAAQIALKPALGGATAVLGVLLLTSGLIDDVDQSPQAILAYAALFGMSQQLLTMFVDRRVGRLLGIEAEAEGKSDTA